jgi:hypothetical protein
VALRIGLPITPEHLLPNIPATMKWLRFESTPMDLYFDVPRNWHGASLLDSLCGSRTSMISLTCTRSAHPDSCFAVG